MSHVAYIRQIFPWLYKEIHTLSKGYLSPPDARYLQLAIALCTERFGFVGVHWIHAVGYVISREFDLPHSFGITLAAPPVLRMLLHESREFEKKLRELLLTCGAPDNGVEYIVAFLSNSAYNLTQFLCRTRAERFVVPRTWRLSYEVDLAKKGPITYEESKLIACIEASIAQFP